VATLWFILVTAMLAMYVIFDGFDIGAGILHLFVAKSGAERRAVLRSIGPVWDGNEVWLIAAGGTLFFAFPALYASGFSGFYLPLMMVLWLLILRGCSIEFRDHIQNEAWRPFWDAVFWLSSSLLAIVFGAALGNVVRGVPFDASGRFFEPLWVDFRPGPDAGILDWYTVLVALAAYASLALHGALWLNLKTTEPVAARARTAARVAWPVTLLLVLAVTAWTLKLQPQVLANLSSMGWGAIFPVLAVAGLAGAIWFLRRGRSGKAFLASSAYLAGMLSSAAFGVYPYVLPSISDRARGLTAQSAAAPVSGLKIGLVWWLIGMALVAVYHTVIYRHFAGRVTLESGEPGYGSGTGNP
jgi:cytochrome bd ubiquinol oxidase subunit II